MAFYYDFSKIQGYNSIYNFIITERGLGKSYGAKKMVVKDFLNGKGQFLIVRRYEEELKLALSTFWDDLIQNEEFEGVEFGIKKGKKLNFLKINGEVAGFAVALSTSSSIKSTPFPNVKTIVFDEFIIDVGRGHYLKNEVEAFFELYESVARRRENVKAYFLGNAISSTNPYFMYDWGNGLHLSLPYGGSEFKTFKNGLITVNYAKNSVYRAEKKKTRFGQLIEGTKYSEYAIENKWLRESKSFISKKDKTAKMISILVLNGFKYGVWRGKNGLWVSDDFDKNCPCIFALDENSHNEKSVLIKARSNPWFKMVVDSFRFGILHFENQKIKSEVMKVLAKTLTF